MWGLPSVRFTPRSVEAAFSGLGGLDVTAWFQVGTCIFSAVVVVIACGSRIGHGLSVLPPTLFRGASFSFLIYFLFAMGSAIYSVNAGFTIYSASKILLLLLCSALLSGSYGGGPRGIAACLRLFYTVNILQWAVIALLFVLAPEVVGGIDPKVGYRLHGGSFGDYGRAAAFSGLLFLVIGLRSQGRRRWFAFAVYGVSWTFVLLSLTRGTMICAAVMMCFAVAARYRTRSRILLTCATLLILSAITLSGGLEQIIKFAARGESRADLESLTGRAQAFHFLINGWKESPWLGFGYGAGNRYLLLHFQQQAGLGIGAAHDAVSRVLTDLGLIGAALLLIASVHIVVATYKMWFAVRCRTELRELAGQVAGLLAYVLIFSVTSSGIAEVTAPVVIVALATAALRIPRRHTAFARTTVPPTRLITQFG
jgi:O-antigen ligase